MPEKVMKRKALVKTVTWRFVATATTVLVALIFTRSIEISLGIGTVEMILKLALYYFHEKAWERMDPSTQISSASPQSL